MGNPNSIRAQRRTRGKNWAWLVRHLRRAKHTNSVSFDVFFGSTSAPPLSYGLTLGANQTSVPAFNVQLPSRKQSTSEAE